MKNLIGVFLLLILTTGCAPAADTPPPGEITLVPHTDEGYSIKTVLPDGWQARSSGVVWRKNGGTDLTLIVQQSANKSAEELLISLLPRLQLSETPESIGSYQGETLKWTLYRATLSMGSSEVTVDLALAQLGDKSYFVFLQTWPQEHDALYESIFLPTLVAFSPLEFVEEPVPYNVEEVTFRSGNVTLAGTLTLPTTIGPHPAMVLVTGSGQQDRDDAMSGVAMRPFRLIADALTRDGIAVLRYDDRGVGGSTGNFLAAALPDFASDAVSAIDYLLAREDIDERQIGLLGHSEGGLVAAMLGAQNKDLDFIIVMAGPGLNGHDLLVLQTRQRMEVEGATQAEIDAQVAFVEALVLAADDPAAIETLTYQYTLEQVKSLSEDQHAALGDIELYSRTVAQQTAQEYSGGWFKSFINYDPASDWAQTSVPVLALFGGKDVQVDAAQNASALEAALQEGGNQSYKIVILSDANHLFQKAETGSFSEYGRLPAEFTPAFLPAILDWLHIQGIG